MYLIVVLKVIEARFQAGKVYSWAGICLVLELLIDYINHQNQYSPKMPCWSKAFLQINFNFCGKLNKLNPCCCTSVHLFITDECHSWGQNVVRKKSDKAIIAKVVSLMFLSHFDVFCDQLLNRYSAKWNLIDLYNKDTKNTDAYHSYTWQYNSLIQALLRVHLWEVSLYKVVAWDRNAKKVIECWRDVLV